MTPERWTQVERLYHAALELAEPQRSAFLYEACAADEVLRREMESLLAYDGAAEDFLKQSALDAAAKSLADRQPDPAAGDPSRNLSGATVSHYHIRRKLGSGGMGVVYEAEDTKLRRAVALKFLPGDVARDPRALDRLRREAQAASALNHPNVCTVYDIDEFEGQTFIVMELLDGHTLSRRIAGKPMPVSEVLPLAVQLADALGAAHARGIVHRDVKPQNIFITPRGQVKVLDFGVAKRNRAGPEDTTLTDTGAVVGTAGYMAPEQIRGGAASPRSDLFSFGVVLYEMLSGKPPFGGPSSVEVMHAILKDDPPALPDTVPPPLGRIVRRCLGKDPDRRFHTAADLAFALQSLAPAIGRPRPRLQWVVGVAAVIVTTTAIFWFKRPEPVPRVTRVAQITRSNLPLLRPLTADGPRLFLSTLATFGPAAYQVSVNGGELAPLNLQPKDAFLLGITPDSTEYLACRLLHYDFGIPECELWAEPVLGGPPHRLGNLVASDAAWSPDGRRLAYTRDGELHIARRDGTELRKVATVGGIAYFPRWSPDGRRIRFGMGSRTGPWRIAEALADSAGWHRLLPGWNPSWSMRWGNWTPDGRYFVFGANNKIWALAEQAGIFRRSSHEPVELNTGVIAADVPVPSPDGKRVFFEGAQGRNEFLRYDSKAGRFSLEFPSVSGTQLEYSKDGKWVVYVSVSDKSLFRSAADGSQRLQLTLPPMEAGMPHWSPDGTQIAFMASTAAKPQRICIVPSEGGTVRQLTGEKDGKLGDWDPSWSPDGRFLAYGASSQATAGDAFIHVLDLRTNKASVLPGTARMWCPRWSPEGRFIAGISVPEWHLVVYDTQTRKQTERSNFMVGYPSWSPDGQFLFFNNREGWWRMRTRDWKIELITDLKSFFRPPVWDWFAPAPNNSLITARSTGTDEIYALDWNAP
jgi:Tol biopolymer transport system component/predicted Ser/Thr protein kinase